MPRSTRSTAKYTEIESLIQQAKSLMAIYEKAKPGAPGLTNFYGYAFWATDLPNHKHIDFIADIGRVAQYAENELGKIKSQGFPALGQEKVDKLTIEDLANTLKGVVSETKHSLQVKADGYFSSSVNSVLYKELNKMVSQSYDEMETQRNKYKAWSDENPKESIEPAALQA